MDILVMYSFNVMDGRSFELLFCFLYMKLACSLHYKVQ